MNQRFELAKAAMQGLLSGGVLSDFEPEYVAETALRCADAMLAALNITPEAVVESQQISAGIVRYRFRGFGCSAMTHGKVYSGWHDGGFFCCVDDNGDRRWFDLCSENIEEVPNA